MECGRTISPVWATLFPHVDEEVFALIQGDETEAQWRQGFKPRPPTLAQNFWEEWTSRKPIFAWTATWLPSIMHRKFQVLKLDYCIQQYCHPVLWMTQSPQTEGNKYSGILTLVFEFLKGSFCSAHRKSRHMNKLHELKPADNKKTYWTPATRNRSKSRNWNNRFERRQAILEVKIQWQKTEKLQWKGFITY